MTEIARERERNGGIGCVCEREIELKFCLSNTTRLDVKNFEMRIGKVSWLESERGRERYSVGGSTS